MASGRMIEEEAALFKQVNNFFGVRAGSLGMGRLRNFNGTDKTCFIRRNGFVMFF